MALTQVRPALQYSDGRSKPWSGAKLVNAFPEKADGDKVTDFAVMAIPGLDLRASVGSGPVRGIHAMGDVLYVVSGEELYSLSEGGFITLIGGIPGSAPVRMVDNGTELGICAAPFGYVLSGGALAIPTGLPFVSDVAYIDSYFVWSVAESDQCVYSGINAGTVYDALDVFTAEGSPDGLVGLVADHRELQLFGTRTVEIFYNAGDADNVFQRQGNAFIERGCFDRDSIVKIDNSVQFFGDDMIVYRLDGYTPVRISTHAVEYKLRAATFARAFTYTQEGHKFYAITADDVTMVYDLATGTWHERQSWDLANYRIGSSENIWRSTVLADAYSGNIYTPNLDRYDENGETIRVVIALPTIEAGRRRVTMYAFEVYCETGVGLTLGQGADPQIMLRYSDDGGRTYSNEMWRSLGLIGDYLRRAVWRTLGQFRQRNIELSITDPVRRFVMSYWADVR